MSEVHRWLVLHLAGPLVPFGDVSIDQIGPTRDFPAASMLTGLIANALGWRRTDTSAHQVLQDRLIFAARWEQTAEVLTDTQNARLEKNDRGWTTWGEPEGRDGNSYGAPLRRKREYLADAAVTVVLRLALGTPDLDAVATALTRPARPLFIGRKSCLPATPILGGEVIAATGYEALLALPSQTNTTKAVWPIGEGPQEGKSVNRIVGLCDTRNWVTGLHGGSRLVVEGHLAGGGETV